VERRLVAREELRDAREGKVEEENEEEEESEDEDQERSDDKARQGREKESKRPMKRNQDQRKGAVLILNSRKSTYTKIFKAPIGMKRNTENSTNWSKNHKCISWQVEWVREGDTGEKMRKNLPYKYKFRRNWGDF